MRTVEHNCKVHLKKGGEDFIVLADSPKAVQDWISDRTIPMAQVISGFKIFTTHGHGLQGIMDTASKGQLEEHFGTSKEEEVIKEILEKGVVQESEVKERHGDTNMSRGSGSTGN